MKKILHISKYYYPYVGGVEVVVQNIVEGLTSYKNEVLCFSDKKENYEDLINGVRVHRVGTDFFIARQAISFSYYKVIKKIIRDYNPNIVHLHCPNPFVYSFLLLLLPKSAYLVLHWHLDIVKQKKIYPFVKFIETKILKRANIILTTSPQYRDASLPLRPYLDKVKVLPNAIDCSRLKKQLSDESVIFQLKQKYKDPIVFFVGRHVSYKGLSYLIEAEKYIKNKCQIIIAGNGPLTPELKSMANSTNRIHFVGRLSDDELRCSLYAADIFAFPSITKNEAFGLALAEAMYCECVPVTFTIPGSGVNWVSLNEVTGLEVENSNSIKYANAIDQLLSDELLKNRLSKNAKKRVIENFTVQKEKETVTMIYNNLL